MPKPKKKTSEKFAHELTVDQVIKQGRAVQRLAADKAMEINRQRIKERLK